MTKKTTVKPIGLGYRAVGESGDYTPLMGVLKGLTIGQDEPDSTEIEAEFYDAPFDIFYDGKPVTMTFELANYDLSELPALFGGSYDIATNTYEGATNAFTSEHEWKLDFGRGNAALVIVRGLTVGTLKKDADGALNYAVTITALVYNDGTNDHMYKVVGANETRYTFSVSSGDATKGIVSQLGEIHASYPAGTEVTVIAAANDNYKFSKWSDNSTENPHTITLNSNKTLTATFVADSAPE